MKRLSEKEKEYKKRVSELKDKDGKEFMEKVKNKLDAREFKIKDGPMSKFLKVKYRLNITNMYEKLHQDYINCLTGVYYSLLSKEQIIRLIMIIENKIMYVNSRETTLRELEEEYEYVKEIIRRTDLPYEGTASDV